MGRLIILLMLVRCGGQSVDMQGGPLQCETNDLYEQECVSRGYTSGLTCDAPLPECDTIWTGNFHYQWKSDYYYICCGVAE